MTDDASLIACLLVRRVRVSSASDHTRSKDRKIEPASVDGAVAAAATAASSASTVVMDAGKLGCVID